MPAAGGRDTTCPTSATSQRAPARPGRRSRQSRAAASEAFQVLDERVFVVAAQFGAVLAAFVAAVSVARNGRVEPPAALFSVGARRDEADVVEIVHVVTDVQDGRPH